MLNAPNASRLTRFKNAMAQYSRAWVTILRNYLQSFTRRKLFTYLLTALFTLGIVSTYPISGLAMFSVCVGMPLVLEILLRTASYLSRQYIARFSRPRNNLGDPIFLEPEVLISPANQVRNAILANDTPLALQGLTNERVANMSELDLIMLCERTIRQNNQRVLDRLLEIASFQTHLANNQNSSFLLQLAVQQRRQQMVTAFLRHPSMQTAASGENNAALREACSIGSLAIIEALLACPNVLANITFNHNEAVRLAESNGHWDIVARLLQIAPVANYVAPRGVRLAFTPRGRADHDLLNLFNLIFGAGGIDLNGLNHIGMVPGNVTLGQFAANRENAMARLSEKEVRELGEIQQRYEPTLRGKGIDSILADIRTFLIKNYENNAVIHQGKKLPLEYNRNLSPAVQKLYYANKAHTAYRYLCLRPNPWIAANALHTDHLANGRASSITHEQKIKIAYLWLAADDETRPAPQGFSHSQLKELFAESILAGAGRCHNYDNNLLNQRAGKEVDDEEGDKPTCSMGTAKWVTQLLTILCDSAPLTSSTLINKFKAILLAEGGHKEAIFNKLNALNHERLSETQEALKNLIVVNLNDKDELEPKEKKLVEHLKFSKSAVDALVTECKTYFGKERIVAKENISYQGKKFESYEALLRHLSKNALQDFYNEIDAKMTSILKSPAAKSAGKVLSFSRTNSADKNESGSEDEQSPKKKNKVGRK